LTALPGRQPANVRGAMFGIVLWFISDRLLIPLLSSGGRGRVTASANARMPSSRILRMR
jgi:hypothetical protein